MFSFQSDVCHVQLEGDVDVMFMNGTKLHVDNENVTMLFYRSCIIRFYRGISELSALLFVSTDYTQNLTCLAELVAEYVIF